MIALFIILLSFISAPRAHGVYTHTLIHSYTHTPLYKGEFVPNGEESESRPDPKMRCRFIVALHVQNQEAMHEEFLAVSSPTSASYGQYLSTQDLHAKYGIRNEAKAKVVAYFSESIPGAELSCGEYSDLCIITADVIHIEEGLRTKLMWFYRANNTPRGKRSLRAVQSLLIDAEVESYIAFISLNVPINHVMPRASKAMMQAAFEDTESEASSSSLTGRVGVAPGPGEALIRWNVYCSSGERNSMGVPCVNSTDAADQGLTFTVSVTSHANSRHNPYLLSSDPLVYTIRPSDVWCYNTLSGEACAGGVNDTDVCTCMAKVSPLPKYRQLRVQVDHVFPATTTNTSTTTAYYTAVSYFFTLTDVATPSFLSTLYGIPDKGRASHGSNQSVAEFYGQFYSNSDLSAFMALSGLPAAMIKGM